MGKKKDEQSKASSFRQKDCKETYCLTCGKKNCPRVKECLQAELE